MAVIYFIRNDSGGEKTQVFIDMDREEVRHDASDLPPGNVLSMVKAYFPKTEVEISYEKKDAETS